MGVVGKSETDNYIMSLFFVKIKIPDLAGSLKSSKVNSANQQMDYTILELDKGS